MFDVGASLLPALASSSQSLARTAQSAQPEQMGNLARQAVFTEALMNAIHARFAEIKNVAHG